MSFECNWDRMLQFTGATWWAGNQRITRSVFPENAETLAIASAYDYLGVNNAVRDGHTVLVGPMNFCRSVGWKPWAGPGRLCQGSQTYPGQPAGHRLSGRMLGHEGVQIRQRRRRSYNVFRNLATGKRVCILTNAAMASKKQVITRFKASRSGAARIHIPFQKPFVVKLPAEIEVPAERIVFVEEL